ncbi:hypothetical protein NHX12_010122, partial [Muraenolepis orangiensis]
GEEGPPSLEYIKAKDLFPQKELVKEDQSLQVPFPALQGEGVEYLGRADEAIIAISNYRLHIKFKDSIVNVPLGLIESVECRDMFQLHIICKDSKVVSADDEDQHLHLCRPGDHVRHRMEMEVKRMGFDTQNAWRVSDINSNYKLCTSYPQKLLVPVHQKNGAVIARCSQPEISWWGWRNTEDEYLVTSIAKACQMDPGQRAVPGCRARGEGSDSTDGDFDSSLTGGPGVEDSPARQKLLILDARSYTAAVANRAKGGGCECEEYYPHCEVMFMGMANIHAIRNSFQALRAVCSQIPDPGNWLSALESTRWLQHLSVMLKAATLVCSGLEREGRPVLVHCSDGWDRTPQIVALAKVLLDPFYRTIEGFQVLVETDWLDYGHKFGDRCGHQENADDVSEQCPVFLQWLDCVHQLIKQFPCLFEFNEAFLVKLVQHTYSCLYGTFLCNNARERDARNIFKRTCSIWSLLRTGNKNFQNFLYIPSHEMVLQPVCHTRALQLWTAVYLPTTSPCTAVDDAMDLFLSGAAAGDELAPRSLDRLPKTRSMDNLLSAFENGVPLTRTSSDPNLNKHCLEGRPPPALGSGHADGLTGAGSDSDDSEAEAVVRSPLRSPASGAEARRPAPLPALEDSTETLTDEGELPEENPGEDRHPEPSLPTHTSHPPGETGTEAVSVLATPTAVDAAQLAARRLISRSPLSDLALLGPRWESVRGLVQSARRSASHSGFCRAYRHRGPSALSAKTLRSQALAASAYLDDDGLPVAMDAVQQRLRQMEACYKQEVELLRQQVRRLQMKLESKQFGSPPSEPDVDYEDDITCLRESDNSNEEDSLSSQSEDRLSEGSWDRVDQRDMEVTRWVPDHMASHCFNCDSEFWMAKRRHHCRNCGNVFCKDCCHLKLPIPDQQLYDPVLVCSTCHDMLLECRNQDIRSQELKKPIATASS